MLALLLVVLATVVVLLVIRRPRSERDVEGFARSRSALADIVERTRHDEEEDD